MRIFRVGTRSGMVTGGEVTDSDGACASEGAGAVTGSAARTSKDGAASTKKHVEATPRRVVFRKGMARFGL
jgi:hypothetical protein